MDIAGSLPSPSSHNPDGGLLLGSGQADRRMILFEDPQCPYCRQFEEACGELLLSVRNEGTLAVEYRMRCFLGPESVRADNALALAAEEDRFDELRRALFSAQPEEGSGGFTTTDLLALGRQVGLTSSHYVSGVEEGRYQGWVLRCEEIFQPQDPQGTPAAWLDGHPVDGSVLSDPVALAALLSG